MTLASAGQRVRDFQATEQNHQSRGHLPTHSILDDSCHGAEGTSLDEACVGMHAAESWLLCGHWYLVQDCVCLVRLFLLSMYQVKVLFSTICCNDTLMAASSESSVPVIARLKKQAMRFIHVTPLQSIKSRPFPVDSGKILHAHVGS